VLKAIGGWGRVGGGVLCLSVFCTCFEGSDVF
jgi:hypothetical protein